MDEAASQTLGYEAISLRGFQAVARSNGDLIDGSLTDVLSCLWSHFYRELPRVHSVER